MDDEAKLRGTTVYLVDKRIDMLPMMLGTDLCSLVGNRDRYAVSVLWVLPPKIPDTAKVDRALIIGNDSHSRNSEYGVHEIGDPVETCVLICRSASPD